jgi:transposase-like protein
MSKKERLPAEVKVKIVKAFLSGSMSMSMIISEYGVHKSTVRNWIRLYETRGFEGLMSYSRSRKYTSETKLSAVQEYLDGKGSLYNVCKKFDISTTSMLLGWIKWYNDRRDFKSTRCGGEIYMIKGKDTTLDERIEIVSHCIANNHDYTKTIEQYSVSYSQVYNWVKKYEANGIDGLVDRRGKRKDEDSMTEVEKLRAEIKLKEAENLRLQMENDLLKKLEEIERGRSHN